MKKLITFLLLLMTAHVFAENLSDKYNIIKITEDKPILVKTPDNRSIELTYDKDGLLIALILDGGKVPVYINSAEKEISVTSTKIDNGKKTMITDTNADGVPEQKMIVELETGKVSLELLDQIIFKSAKK